MDKLTNLIKNIQTNSIEFKKLSDIAKCIKGKQLNKESLLHNGEYPVINGGMTPSGFWNAYNFPSNRITISQGGASAGYVAWQETPFWAGAHCYVLIDECSNINYKYLYHVIKMYETKLTECQYGAGIPALSAKTLNDLDIPLPPLDVQKEIADILDCFLSLSKKLKVELEKRKKQYEYYIKNIFEEAKKSNYLFIKDICNVEKGKSPIQKTESGEYPMVVTTEQRKSSNKYQFDSKSVCIPLISSRGHGVASLNHVYYQEGKFALGNILAAVTPKNEQILIGKYLYYYLELTKDTTLVPLMKGGANVSMHISDILTVKVPVPNIKTQKYIINTLETFDNYCKKLECEITKRITQYEYYRNKLLSF